MEHRREHPDHKGYFQDPNYPQLWYNDETGRCLNDSSVAARDTIKSDPLAREIRARFSELEEQRPVSYEVALAAMTGDRYRAVGSLVPDKMAAEHHWPVMYYSKEIVGKDITHTVYGWVISPTKPE